MKVHVFRVQIKDDKLWAVCDDNGQRLLYGKAGENRQNLIFRWTDLYQKPEGFIAYGLKAMKQSEMIMTILDLQSKPEKIGNPKSTIKQIEKLSHNCLTLMDERGRSNPEANSTMLWNSEWSELRQWLFEIYQLSKGEK